MVSGMQNVPQAYNSGENKVIFFTAGEQLSTNENTLLNAIFEGNLVSFDVIVRNIHDDDGASIEPGIMGVMAYYPAVVPTRYAALVTAGTLKDFGPALLGAGLSPAVLFPGLPANNTAVHTAANLQAAFVSVDSGAQPSDQTLSANVTWSSGTPGTATIASNGKITGVAAGSTIITATLALNNMTYAFHRTLTLT